MYSTASFSKLASVPVTVSAFTVFVSMHAPEFGLSGRFTSLLMRHFLSKQEINQPFPVFVLQTPMSSATSSWQRWRFAEMLKGRRKRRHKQLRSDDGFSPAMHFSALLCGTQTLNTTSRSSRCETIFVSFFIFCLAQHPVASYVIELHCCVLEVFFFCCHFLLFLNCAKYFLSLNHQTYLVWINPEYVLNTKWCTASPNIAHTGQHLW